MAFQNTVGNSFQSILASMQQGLAGQFKTIREGSLTPGDSPLPAVGIELLDYADVGRVENNRKKRVTLKLRVIFGITQSNKTDEATSHTSKVDDFLDTVPIPNGVQGFDDIKWSLTLPSGEKVSDIGFADAITTYTVIVPRGAN